MKDYEKDNEERWWNLAVFHLWVTDEEMDDILPSISFVLIFILLIIGAICLFKNDNSETGNSVNITITQSGSVQTVQPVQLEKQE